MRFLFRNIVIAGSIGCILCLCWYIFIFHPPMARERERFLTDNIVKMFLNDKEVHEIRSYRILIDDKVTVCDKKNTRPMCKEKIDKYLRIMEKVPKYAHYNICNGFIVRHMSFNHYVWIGSSSNIINSGVNITSNFKGWLEYYLDSDLFDDGGSCYPWNNLEDYWKRYGKASPESIQAVIGAGKNP